MWRWRQTVHCSNSAGGPTKLRFAARAAPERWRSGQPTAMSRELFVVAPEPEHFDHSLVLEHLIDQTMLNVDAA